MPKGLRQAGHAASSPYPWEEEEVCLPQAAVPQVGPWEEHPFCLALSSSFSQDLKEWSCPLASEKVAVKVKSHILV